MIRRGAALLAALSLAVLVLAAPDGPRPPGTVAALDKPNIVVFYLDDTSPHDGRLWTNPAITPNLTDLFVTHGVHFPNAIGETPLCCPARSTLLTGLHTHNHGVKINDGQLFNPGETVARELTNSGYSTMLLGKYLNKVDAFTPAQWQQHSAAWSVFDAFMSPASESRGNFTGYTLFTKDGPPIKPPEHSTQMIADRAVMRMGQADPAKPIFALLSMSDTHLPNIPMPGFENDPRWAMCNAMPPWNPPNYNEADMSDKPEYMRNLPLLPHADGWPMATYCKEMLGVDWLVGRVTTELRAEGRFDNTMFMFAADNGMDWGAHRLTLKDSPYSTPLPLYFSWQSHWGADPRTIEEYTSNIDLAPTFCDYGGCTLGPYPTGQTAPDGVSLKPLLEGTSASLGRDALLETEYRVHPWAAVLTTDLNPLGLWHYIKYETGFRELYDVDPDADPYELNNLAYDPAYADIRADLDQRLVELLAEGRPASGNATVKIVQDSLPNGAQDFAFQGDLGMFTLDDDATPTLPRLKTFVLPAGAYNVSQVAVPGWTLVSLNCPPATDIDLANGSATLHLFSGDQVSCTFKTSRRRPDLAIGLAQLGPFKGGNVYNTTAVKKQTQRHDGVVAGQTYDYWLTVQNDGGQIDSFTVKGVATGPASMQVAYFVGGTDVTADVVAGTYTISDLAPNATATMVVRVTVAPDATIGSKMIVIVQQISVNDPSRMDVVRAITTY